MVYGDGPGPGLPEPEVFDVASLGELFTDPLPGEAASGEPQAAPPLQPDPEGYTS